MAASKSQKIQAEIEKVKAKIAEQQARLKELEQKMTECAEKLEFEKATEYRDLLGTSRKYALAILEFFDKTKVTKMVGDHREVIGSL